MLVLSTYWNGVPMKNLEETYFYISFFNQQIKENRRYPDIFLSFAFSSLYFKVLWWPSTTARYTNKAQARSMLQNTPKFTNFKMQVCHDAILM
jgi:threonine/homoserine/homoserine lactone efflux protein